MPAIPVGLEGGRKMTIKRIKFHLLVCFLTANFIFVVPAYAATIWYVDASAPAGGDGTSWATAYRDIQSAINSASGIWIICTSPPSQVWVKAGTYNLNAQIIVNKVVAIYGGFDGTETTLSQRDWQNNTTIINGNKSVRCFEVSTFCEINGLAIENGSASSGAGIYIDADPVFCSFGNYYLSPRIRNCTIRYNTASTAGGGIYVIDSDPVIENCTFYGNSGGSGGAIYHISASPAIEKCIFHDNESTLPGSLGGGAIGGYSRDYPTGALVTITNCLFCDNHSESWGGAISYNEVYPTITNCTFSLNSADITGGAFHGNMYSEAPKIHNSICWQDTPDELDIVTASGYLDVSYCDVQGGWTGPGSHNIDANPDFVGLGNYHLLFGSPCIDSASNGYGPDDDLEGISRPRDGDGDTTATCDMGVYEYTIGDFRIDGRVDFPDFSVFALAWWCAPKDIHWNAACDISTPKDDFINFRDLDVFVSHWLEDK